MDKVILYFHKKLNLIASKNKSKDLLRMFWGCKIFILPKKKLLGVAVASPAHPSPNRNRQIKFVRTNIAHYIHFSLRDKQKPVNTFFSGFIITARSSQIDYGPYAPQRGSK